MIKKSIWLIGAGLIFSAVSHAATSDQQPSAKPLLFSSHDSIQSSVTCFRGPFQSHQTFIDMLLQKNKNRPAAAQQKLAEIFNKEDFDRYQQQLDCQTFTYTVDGVPVTGWMMKPKQHQGKLPVLIYNRGGNGEYGSIVMGFAYMRLMPWAERGYMVIASNYRGEHNWPRNQPVNVGHDEFGGAEVNDVRALWPILQQSPAADMKKVAMFGESRGGMMTYLAAKSMPGLKTVISSAGVSDLVSELQFRPEMEKMYEKRIPYYQLRKDEALKERSVVHFIDQIPAALPMLLLHGSADKQVDVKNSERLAKLLQQRHQPHKLVIYPGDDHGLNINRKQADAEIGAWLDKYLQ
jgi:dipeptidyl aminopeptidase/acylaminoacyl peptidase